MKKIISLVVFVILLAWTWNVIHSDPEVSYETHAIIQTKLGDIIQQSVQKHRPDAQDFKLLKLWTETLNSNRIRAHFTYQFKETTGEEPSQQTVTGEALLQKAAGESTQENWKVEKVTTSSNQVVFEEGILVTPESTPAETAPTDSTSSPPEAPAAPPATGQ